MFVGVLRLTLYMSEPGSLKSKRHLLRSAIDRVKAKYNVSIAEVGENDLWQRSVVGVAAVGNDHAFVNETLDKVADFVTSMHGGQIQVTDRTLSIESYGEGLGDLLAHGLKDPRITGFITVTGAKMAPDLKEVTVYVSIHGDDATREKTLEGLRSAAGYL